MNNYFDSDFLGLSEVIAEKPEASTHSLDQFLRGETPAASPRREQPNDDRERPFEKSTGAKQRQLEALKNWRAQLLKLGADTEDADRLVAMAEVALAEAAA